MKYKYILYLVRVSQKAKHIRSLGPQLKPSAAGKHSELMSRLYFEELDCLSFISYHIYVCIVHKLLFCAV